MRRKDRPACGRLGCTRAGCSGQSARRRRPRSQPLDRQRSWPLRHGRPPCSPGRPGSALPLCYSCARLMVTKLPGFDNRNISLHMLPTRSGCQACRESNGYTHTHSDLTLLEPAMCQFVPSLTKVPCCEKIKRIPDVQVFPPKCGPVAQLGARFHGMEEVVGSIPTRSTKFLNNLDGLVGQSHDNCVVSCVITCPFGACSEGFERPALGIHTNVAVPLQHPFADMPRHTHDRR